MRRNELPDTCLSTLPSTGQLVVLKHGVRGYYRSGGTPGIAQKTVISQTAITGGAALRIFRKLP
ncbi:MAG: hypothetical protein ACLR01_12155 [Vescimonas sp.]